MADLKTQEAIQRAQDAVNRMWGASIGRDVPSEVLDSLQDLTAVVADLVVEVRVYVTGTEDAKAAVGLRTAARRQ